MFELSAKGTRRRNRAVISITVTALLLAACAGQQSTQAPSGTIQFWGRAELGGWDKLIVDAFNKSHTNLQVKYSPISDVNYVAKLSEALRTNNVPDVVSIDDVSSLQYISKKQFLDITDKVNSLSFKDKLNKPQLDLATLGGKVYGTPGLADLSVLLYNKALFQQAGIAGPPKSFNDILKDARAIRALGADTYGFTFGGQCGGCLTFTVLPMVYADGGNIFNGDIDKQTGNVEGNDKLRQTLQLYKTIWKEGLAPKAAQAENGSTWTKDFNAGKIGIAPSGLFTYAGASDQFKSNIGVTPLMGPGGGISTYIGGANFAIPAKSANPSGAWEYLKFALDLDQQRLTAKAGFSPVRTDLSTDPAFAQEFPQNVPGLTAAVTGNAPRTLFHNEIFTQSSGPWLAMFNKAVFGGDIDGAMRDGQTAFDRVLKG